MRNNLQSRRSKAAPEAKAKGAKKAAAAKQRSDPKSRNKKPTAREGEDSQDRRKV